MQLREKLLGGELACFVGRDEELSMLRHHVLGAGNRQWLHLYGQGGIGKSTLLRRLHADLAGANVYYLDGSKGSYWKEGLLLQLSEQAEREEESEDERASDDVQLVRRINRRSKLSGQPAVLMIDAFDNLRPLEGWLTEWLSQWDASVRIITAGRQALTGGWLRSGWAGLIDPIRLQALGPADVDRYARKRGLTGSGLPARLFRFCRGSRLP
ncbi:ATP-binding protein [Paenibacillus sp. CC-CFT747]|nr:ATP-binding protein [Paenibacillus sp. CC-CFT747]